MAAREPGDLIERINAGPPFPDVAEICRRVETHGPFGFHFTAQANVWRYLWQIQDESPKRGFPLDVNRSAYAAEYCVTWIEPARPKPYELIERINSGPPFPSIAELCAWV